MATVQIIIGSMFSGKSTELLRRCKTYTAINQKVLVINHTYDTRCKNEIRTHDNVTFNALKTNNLLDVKITDDIQIIAIDESQFFNDLYEFVKQHEHKNIVILIAGLDGDSNREMFGQILKCIPLCNSVTKLSAMCSICKDGTLGSFSKRINAENNEKIFVGASVEYLSVCRKHYFIPSNGYDNLNM